MDVQGGLARSCEVQHVWKWYRTDGRVLFTRYRLEEKGKVHAGRRSAAHLSEAIPRIPSGGAPFPEKDEAYNFTRPLVTMTTTMTMTMTGVFAVYRLSDLLRSRTTHQRSTVTKVLFVSLERTKRYAMELSRVTGRVQQTPWLVAVLIPGFDHPDRQAISKTSTEARQLYKSREKVLDGGSILDAWQATYLCSRLRWQLQQVHIHIGRICLGNVWLYDLGAFGAW